MEKHCENGILKHREAAVSQVDSERRVINFVASTEEQDRDLETVVTRGIDTAAYSRNPTLLLDHDRRVPLGRVVGLGVERLGAHDALVGTAEILPPGTSRRADEAWGEIQAGARNGISIAFLVVDADPPGTPRRVIRRSELLEISSVTMPSCRACVVIGTSGAKALTDQAALAAMHERIQQRGVAIAERLAKLESLVAYRHIDMTGFTLQDPRRHLAREALFFATKELGIPVPALKFFTSTDPDRAEFVNAPIWGYADKGGIGIEWTLAPAEMVQVVAHECGHTAGLGEAEAEAFGKSFAARHGRQFNAAPLPGAGFTAEQLGYLGRVIRSGLPIPR